MTDQPLPENHDELDALVREVVARHYSDPEARTQALLDLSLLQLFEHPDVVEAEAVLAEASPADLDAAFAAIRDGVASATDPRPASKRRRELAAALSAPVGEIVAPLRDLFVSPMAPAAIAAGPDARPTEELAVEEVSHLTFEVPEELAAAAGLSLLGQAEIGDGELRVVIPRRRPESPPPLVVMVEAGDHRAPPTRLVTRQFTVEATLDWVSSALPATIRIGVLAEAPPTV